MECSQVLSILVGLGYGVGTPIIFLWFHENQNCRQDCYIKNGGDQWQSTK